MNTYKIRIDDGMNTESMVNADEFSVVDGMVYFTLWGEARGGVGAYQNKTVFALPLARLIAVRVIAPAAVPA